MPRLRLLLALPLLLILPASALGVPLQLAHHGQLLDSQGDPVTGSRSITFRLYDGSTSGAAVWSEVLVVDVVAGHYSALLSLDAAGRDVLRDEPSLWLELEIGGQPLLPRQPVAAAPYALVADTAENVEGGTVNAQSISVNASTVIDGAGTWTGGAGSLPWDALAGVPAGLQDGDGDVLAGLSCANGDRAVYDGPSGQWECGLSTVTLDRLDRTGVVAPSVLHSDGAQTSWLDASGLAGLLNVYRVTESHPMNLASNITASCLSNDVLLGGGCSSGQMESYLRASSPGTSAWSCSWQIMPPFTASTTDITATAICLEVL